MNFQLLGSLFDDRMNRLFRSEAHRPTGDAETESVKTYLLELTDHGLTDLKLASALRDLFTTPPSESFRSLSVHFTDRDQLFQVTGKFRNKRIVAYVDYRDSRFLRLHSTTRTDLLDPLVHGWTAKLPELDHGWFDDNFLDYCSGLGDFRGIGIEFNNAILTRSDADLDDVDDLGDSIKLRQTGRAHDMLDLLRGSEKFSQQSSLSMVRVKYPKRRPQSHITAEVRFDGRISGRGNSFIRHSEIVERVVSHYKKRITSVERHHSVSAKAAGTGYVLVGRPVVIHVEPSIERLDLFCARVFGAVNPFRLAGVARRVGKDHYTVRAVDLHTSQTLRFEITPHKIWIFLPAGTCGNTVLRFVTNLQRHHSRLTKAENLGGGAVDAL